MIGRRMTRGLKFLILFWFRAVMAFAGSHPPFQFIENKNQWPEIIDFSTRVPGGNLFVQPDRLRFSFLDERQLQALHEHGHAQLLQAVEPGSSDECVDGRAIQLIFAGANPDAEAHPFGRIPTTFSYFIGNDESKWGHGARAFEGILYKSIYPGIDLKIYSEGNNLKYDFILAPGADPRSIVVDYQGADQLWLDHGDVAIQSSLLSLTEQRPEAYQVIEGRRKTVRCDYILNGDRVSYSFPDSYDPCYELVIDPLLIFSTYSGSTADNWGSTATPGENGRLYSSGVTSEINVGGTFPATVGAFQTSYGGLYDVAILKYDSTGQQLLYASFLGGSSSESPHSLVMNSRQELLVLGTTSSFNFPTTNGAIDRTFHGGAYEVNVIPYSNGSDIFVSKISKDGSQLLASTLIGGTANDGLNPTLGLLVQNYGDQLRGDIITDTQGNIFVSTVTASGNFPVINSFGMTYRGGDTDAVVMKLNSSLTQISWSALLGGNGSDASHTIKLDQAGNIFVAGGSSSPDFPTTTGSYQPAHAGSADGWIANLAGDGAAIRASTFTGTAAFDQIYFLDLNQQEEVYVYGQTAGSFPVTPGVYSNPNSGQFIQKFDHQLSSLRFSTVFGAGRGIPDISPTAFLVNDCNNLYMTGWGGVLNWAEGFWNSNTFGLPVTDNAFQKTTSGSDFYFIVLTDDAKQFLYGTYMGGMDSRTHVDGGTSRFDKKGVVYHAVCSGCQAFNAKGRATSDFPTTASAHSRTNQSGNCNNAAFKFDLSSLHALIQTNTVKLSSPGFSAVCLPDQVAFQNWSTGGQSFEWSFGDGTKLVRQDTSFIVHRYEQPGSYLVWLKAVDAGTCIGQDSTFTTITVYMPSGKGSDDQVICSGASATLIASGGVAYDWKSEDGAFASQESQPVVTPEDSTRYFLTVTDQNRCIRKDTIKVSVVPGIDLQFKASKIYDCFSRPSVSVRNLTDPKEEVFFDFGDGTTSDLSEDVHQFQNDGVYPVRLIGKKEFCVYDQRIDLPVYELKVPNVITPNDSPGQNDTFVIVYGDKPISKSSISVSLTVYNRWGGKVYQSNDYRDDWSAEGVPAGVYFYEAVMKGETTCKGWVKVIK